MTMRMANIQLAAKSSRRSHTERRPKAFHAASTSAAATHISSGQRTRLPICRSRLCLASAGRMLRLSSHSESCHIAAISASAMPSSTQPEVWRMLLSSRWEVNSDGANRPARKL